MDAKALFLNDGIVADRIDLQAGGQRDGAKRVNAGAIGIVIGLGHM